MQNEPMINRDFYISFELENMLFYILECLKEFQKTEEIPDTISLLQIYLEHHFAQDITLEAMAGFTGISKYHLCRQFKKFYSAF
jgi:AraC-like DNA-binding protein